jgi:hypothetical protein
MQSSAVMTIRATVLLVCLIAVPVIAISGKNVPEFVKSLIRDHTGTPANAASMNSGSPDAPVFRPGLLAATAGSPSPEGAGASPGPASDLVAAREVASGNSANPGPTPPAVFGPVGDARFANPRNGTAGVFAEGRGNTAAAPGGTTVAHQRESPPGLEKGAIRQVSAVSGDGDFSGGRFSRDYFRAAEARLRGLGATYYLLETLGSAGEQYRFVCKVAAAGQEEKTLAFFAVDRDPLAAMNDVVRQVETWRTRMSQ